jgi:hypothetical protein
MMLDEILELLRNHLSQIKIANTSNEVESQAEAFSAVSIAFG